MKFSIALLAVAASTVAAVPRKPIDACPTKCIDGVNPCGVRWGGCYNICTEKKPVPPPCTISTTLPKPTPTAVPEDDCSKRIICIDAVNECGIPYGGCVPDCRPLAITKPPCPATATDMMTAYAAPTAN